MPSLLPGAQRLPGLASATYSHPTIYQHPTLSYGPLCSALLPLTGAGCGARQWSRRLPSAGDALGSRLSPLIPR